MRIVSGKHKSRRLHAPKNLPTRPTTDMAKEALFNILYNSYDFEELSVLDLFAGIGSISIEFASRGTQHIQAIDRHFECIRFINKVSKDLDLPIKTVKSEVFKYLESSKATYDIIFADPPYDLDLNVFIKLIELVFDKNMLNHNGLLILEHSKHMDLSTAKNYVNSKKYGASMFSFFKDPAIATSL